MKLLKEEYGESEELDTFVNQLERKYSDYYVVKLEHNNKTQNKYFSNKSAAREYFDKILDKMNDDKEYYDGAIFTMIKTKVSRDEEEIKSIIIEEE